MPRWGTDGGRADVESGDGAIRLYKSNCRKEKGQMKLEQLLSQHLCIFTCLTLQLCCSHHKAVFYFTLKCKHKACRSQGKIQCVKARICEGAHRSQEWSCHGRCSTYCVLRFLLASAPWKSCHWSYFWPARWLIKGISKLLTQPRGKAQAAIHFLAPGNPSSVQQTCSSAGRGLRLVLGGAAWGHLYMMEACSSLFNWRWI